MKPLFALALTLSMLIPTAASQAETRVRIDTSLGPITLSLDEARAPITVQNFMQYVDSGFYEGLVFHRVIPDFMIQGGGLTAELTPKQTQAPIKNEANNGLRNQRGSIAMARMRDPDSATAQFFINTKDNAFLDYAPGNPGYAVFGKVVAGMDTVDQISQVNTGTQGYFNDVPSTPILIKSISRLSE